MLKSRLYWKVFANFATLLVILSALTWTVLRYIKQIETHFDIATSDTKVLIALEQIRSYLSDVPIAATQYTFTKSPDARSLYTKATSEFDITISGIRERIRDSVAQQTLSKVRELFYAWVENVGNQKVFLSEKNLSSDEFVKGLQALEEIDAKNQYMSRARYLLEDLYQTKLNRQPYSIELARKQSGDLAFYVIFVNVLLAIFAIALGFVLTHSITKPVQLVRRGAEDIMAGKFGQIDLHRSDELGKLAEVFNQMSRMLGENYSRLNAYSELVTILNNLKGLEEVQTKSLQLLCAHTSSTLGALYILNKREDYLELAATYGLSSDTRQNKLRIGEGIPGQCALEKKVIKLHDIPELKNHVIHTGVLELIPKTVVALPILFQDQLLGVLVLAAMHSFEKSEMEILHNSIPQLAVAITNAVNDDATRRLSLEIAQRNEELNAKNAELEDAYRVKSDFLASMSHELRTPMNSIIGFSSVLLAENTDPLTADQHMAIEKVLKNGKHLLQLINDILDLSKLEAGRMTINVETEEIQSILSNSILTIEPMLKSKELHFATEVTTKIAAVTTDTVKVKQVLMNLLSNAVKFTERGGITIRVYDRDGLVAFSVQDSGIGIEKKNLELIFKEFQQVDSSNTRKYKGTGLGLSIARRLARMLGGDLVAESISGQGTTFTFTVPPVYISKKTEETISAIRTQPLIRQEQPQKGFGVTAFKGAQILCIDDDPDVLEILKKYLTPEGYSVECALSGDEGIKIASQIKPALITLDIMMPNKDGWQVLRELKGRNDTKDIPVIIHSIVDNKPLALSLGAVDFLTKPTEPRLLLDVVERFCDSTRSILVIDDNEDFALTVKQLLSRDYQDVRMANSGHEALDILKNFMPSLIFLDLAMPEMDGFEVVSRLQNDEHLRNIPVVILSGKEVSTNEMNQLNRHITEFIRKGDLASINLSTIVTRILKKR